MFNHRIIIFLLVLILFPAFLYSWDLCDPDSVTAEVEGDSVVVYHWNAEYNCCPQLEFGIEVVDSLIHITERDTMAACLCDCCFDLTVVLKDLIPGTYTIMVWDWDMTELYGKTTITVGGKGKGAYIASTDRSDCKIVGIKGEVEKAPGIGGEPLQNYPNPFNPMTTIEVVVPEYGSGKVELAVYDMRGRHVKTLMDGVIDPGKHLVAWDGKDDMGRKVPSGVYLYTLRVGDRTYTRKMDLVK